VIGFCHEVGFLVQKGFEMSSRIATGAGPIRSH
jgi:hypothetical protein